MMAIIIPISRDIADFPTEIGFASSIQFEDTFLTVGGICDDCDEDDGSDEYQNRDIVKFLPDTSTWEVLAQHLPMGGAHPAFLATQDFANAFCSSR